LSAGAMEIFGKGVRLLAPFALLVEAAEGATVYRWVDADGSTHFSDQPHAGANRLELSTPVPADEWLEIAEVLDGDTLRLVDGRSVRFIGINAPEVAHRNRQGEPGGVEAQTFLSEYLAGRRIRLEREGEEKDRYGRLLAHVHTAEGNVAEALLRAGMAWVSLYPGESTHTARYLELEAEARTAATGLWALARYQVQPSTRAAGFRNSFRRLRGRVARIEPKGSGLLLALDGLTLHLDDEALARFRAAGMYPETLRGRMLVVRGRVRQRDGEPALVLTTPLQVERVE